MLYVKDIDNKNVVDTLEVARVKFPGSMISSTRYVKDTESTIQEEKNILLYLTVNY